MALEVTMDAMQHGAEFMDEWRRCRVAGDALRSLGAAS